MLQRSTYYHNSALRFALWTVLFALCLAACDVEDERDLCCEQVVMEYRYLYEGQDQFKGNIHALRHFLFDDRERFVQEMPPGGNLKLQPLDGLSVGSYTIVTIGNATQATRIETPDRGSPLSSFVLSVQDEQEGNTDPLFYSLRRFTLSGEKRHIEQRLVTDLANVHCKLQVTVNWQNLPPVLSNERCYRMTLDNCAMGYELDGARGYLLGGKPFPYSPTWGRNHRIDCALEGLQLKAEFTSLRYTNGQIPVLNILCREGDGYVAQTPPLDLKRAFNTWGYQPEGIECQNYKIVVTIYLDGHVGVKIEAEAGVADWVNGGNFG